MRIVVNDIAASKGGALTVLKDFYNCVRENDTENEWIFLLGEKLLEDTDNIKSITLPQIKGSRIKKLAFDLFTGKKFMKSLKPDLIFSLQNTIVFGVDVPQVIYLHQSIPFQKVKKFSFFKKAERSLAVYQHLIGRVIKKSVKTCDKVIVQTDWMKDAVCSQCRVPREKVLKISPVVGDISAYNTSHEFKSNLFFYPTATAIYKNNQAIFSACNMLSAKGLDYNVILTLPGNSNIKNVNCVGKLPYAEVIETYSKSTLIFPSYIETFGFPMAEARKVGTLILASDCPFSREVLKDYDNAYFFDPFKPEKLAELMENVIIGNIQKKKVEISHLETTDTWKTILNEILNLPT